jgi:hypothetical protein
LDCCIIEKILLSINGDFSSLSVQSSGQKLFNWFLHVGGTFCDLDRAFDCLNEESLLAVLCFYGTGGVSADRFRSFLTNRK